jgi:hypothetical protein
MPVVGNDGRVAGVTPCQFVEIADLNLVSSVKICCSWVFSQKLKPKGPLGSLMLIVTSVQLPHSPRQSDDKVHRGMSV